LRSSATAEANGMVVVTRNVKHFAPLGVRVLDPWAGQSRPE
jgi:predicted nucleic acid-binding protein